ncbi:MAG TPA: hypothetical protein VIJ04_03315, partial [Xanthobacteraceae bacterium]
MHEVVFAIFVPALPGTAEGDAIRRSESSLAIILRQCERIVVPRQAGGVMISRTTYGRTVLLTLAAGFSLASVLPAGAQTASPGWPADIAAAPASATPDATDNDASDADTADADAKDADTKTADTETADTANLEPDWSQLNVDASTLIATPASKARLPQAGPSTEMTWSSQARPNGSAAVSVKQALSPFWDA